MRFKDTNWKKHAERRLAEHRANDSKTPKGEGEGNVVYSASCRKMGRLGARCETCEGFGLWPVTNPSLVSSPNHPKEPIKETMKPLFSDVFSFFLSFLFFGALCRLKGKLKNKKWGLKPN